MPSIDQITDLIQSAHRLSQACFHRQLVVLSGSSLWCKQIVFHLLETPYCEDTLLISNQVQFPNTSSVPAEKLSHHLGHEYSTLIWDGFSGLSPDGLGIASGLLKGGGLFFLLLPPITSLSNAPDPDYLRMCSQEDDLSTFSTFFLQRLCQSIYSDTHVILIEENKSLPKWSRKKTRSSSFAFEIPTADQIAAISAIKKVALGHRHRPLVIKANRGRGKSSALGLAAAELYLEKGYSFAITAPSPSTCDAAFRHFRASIYAHLDSDYERKKALASFRFIPLDALEFETSDYHMLFVDEAAAIPNALLLNLLHQYNRIVFATTIHGYEGNGQGFALRFQKHLASIRPEWKSITLTMPLRWAPDDPLESWFFNLLLLNYSLEQDRIETQSQTPASKNSLSDLDFEEVPRTEIAQNETLLKQIVSLLVIAHYQTKPSDIRMLLDHPRIKVLLAMSKSRLGNTRNNALVRGVCLVIEEGGLTVEPDLSDGILEGRRRLRGQLFPQALSSFTAETDFLKQTTYRVMRIAVHPDFQKNGIGSQLLETLKGFAQENGVDYLSTSYGLTDELLCFWLKNHFHVVKLGLKVDGSSGLQSIMMMQALSTNAYVLLALAQQTFLDAFVFDLPRQFQNLKPSLVGLVLQNLKPQKRVFSLTKVESYAFASRALEETGLELFNLLLQKTSNKGFNSFDPETLSLLIMKILQNHSIEHCVQYFNMKGKKQLDDSLRKAVSQLLSIKSV